MAGKVTRKYELTSGAAPALSGLAKAFGVDGSGRLRELRVEKGFVSGTVRLCVLADSGLVLDNGVAILGSGDVVPCVDIIGSGLQGSGNAIISGVASTVALQPVEFSENLAVQYSVTSGHVLIAGMIEIDKRLIT